MSNYVNEKSKFNALAIIISYLGGSYNDSWAWNSQTTDGNIIQTWIFLKAALASQFITLSKDKTLYIN